jgi:hypothetical protein
VYRVSCSLGKKNLNEENAPMTEETKKAVEILPDDAEVERVNLVPT